MIVRDPSPGQIDTFLEEQRSAPLTYSPTGLTTASVPPGFVVDHTRTDLGNGEETFQCAVRAVRRWQQFQLGWLTASPVDTPIQIDAVICIAVRFLGFTWLNACRIVQVIDEDGPIRRFGFAYGTMPSHAECGEERFLVEWDRASDGVSYDILAVSRPRHILARIGYPLARRLQKRFARDSAARMRSAVDIGC